jgi:hypothetical protein
MVANTYERSGTGAGLRTKSGSLDTAAVRLTVAQRVLELGIRCGRGGGRGCSREVPFLHAPRIMTARHLILLAVLLACGCARTADHDRASGVAGADRTAKTTALETGAALLQPRRPVEQISTYLSGFHPMKEHPEMQMESHHYCNQVNDDFAQCVLFDRNGDGARLHGVEFIVSARLYDTLPEDEGRYWHPHNYEILSGMLRAPGLPEAAEHEAMKQKVNSYGKTWHVWQTGPHGEGGDQLPLGPPQLAWSFNADGEAAPELVETRDRRMGLDTGAERQRRGGWSSFAHPQAGVDDLARDFPQRRGAPPGVRDAQR